MKRYLAVLVLLVCGAVACVRTPQMRTPAPPDARAYSHRIGILELPPLQLMQPVAPAPGVGAGYKRGVGECFDGGLAPSYLILAATLVLCPTVGGAVGVAQNASATEVAEAREALERIGREHPFGDGLRDELAHRLAREAPHYAVALLAPDGTDPLGAPVDAVVNLVWFQVYLMQCDTDRHTVPPLTLYAWVHAELVRVADRTVLHRARVEYWGEAVSLVAWGAGGGERLARGLARAQRSLAEQLAQSFFLAQTPTPMTWPFCKNQPWRNRWER